MVEFEREPFNQEKEVQTLEEYAEHTWYSIDASVCAETGLPFDKMTLRENDSPDFFQNVSPTDIAALIWSTIAARDLGIIESEEASKKIGKTLDSLKKMERSEGAYFNWYNPQTRDLAEGIYPFVSTVDNAWLMSSLMILSEAIPKFASDANSLLKEMNFKSLYDERKGFLYGGYYPTQGRFTGWHYGVLNSDSRIASYIGIARGDFSEKHYYQMHRTPPCDGQESQSQTPKGKYESYQGVRVFEGRYSYREINFVPTYNGTLFEALLASQFIPEREWGPRNWGVNHKQYVKAQIEYGKENYSGYWGISPSSGPSGGYREYRIPELGINPNNYEFLKEKVITPHALFLALEIIPQEVLENLKKLKENFARIYGKYGFADSVEIQTGETSSDYLIYDQSMVIAAITNFLLKGKLRGYLACQVEKSIRPLLESETFFID